MGQNHKSSHCCCLDNTSPRLAFTSTSTAASGCSIPRPEELVPVSPCLCPPRGLQLFHFQVNFTFQECARKCTVDFHSQVNFTSQENSRKCTVDFHSQVNFTSQESARKCTVAFVQIDFSVDFSVSIDAVPLGIWPSPCLTVAATLYVARGPLYLLI